MSDRVCRQCIAELAAMLRAAPAEADKSAESAVNPRLDDLGRACLARGCLEGHAKHVADRLEELLRGPCWRHSVKRVREPRRHS